MFRFIYLLRRSNNFRLAMVWLLIVVHWIVNHTFFVVTTKFSDFSNLEQKHLNFYYSRSPKTDYELVDSLTQFRLDWAHASHQIWWFLLICGIIYLVALREEIGRAIIVARARTHAWIDLPDPPAPASAGGGVETPRRPRRERIWEQAYVFVREFLMALLAERLGERRVSS